MQGIQVIYLALLVAGQRRVGAGGESALGYGQRLGGARKKRSVVVGWNVGARRKRHKGIGRNRPHVQVWLEDFHLLPVGLVGFASLGGAGEQVVQVFPLESDEDLRFGRFGFDQRVDAMVQADVVGGIFGVGVHIGVDLRSQPQVAGVELPHNPEGVVGKGRAYLRVGKTGFPTERQPHELAAVQSIQRVYHVNGLQTILYGQRHLVADVSALLRLAVYAVRKIVPGDRVLKKHEIGMLPQVFEVSKDAFQ